MTQRTRRGFLRGAVVAAVAGPWTLAPARTARAIPPLGRTRPSHLKLSVAAYSYRQFLQGPNPRMDLFDFVNLAADAGADAVEPTSYYFPDDVNHDYLHRLKQHAFVVGLDISGTAIRNDFCLPYGPKRDAELEHVRTWVDRAAELDAPVIRIFAGHVPQGDTADQAEARVVEGIQAALPYAAERGVILALENHGGITATPDGLLKLVKAVNAPNFGVNLDTANFHTDDPYADLARLAPYAVNVQVKTEVQRRGKRKEPADLARLIGILRDARYAGYVVLEHEAKEDPIAAVPRHLKTLRQLIG